MRSLLVCLSLVPALALADLPSPDGMPRPSTGQRITAQRVVEALVARRFKDVIASFDETMTKQLSADQLAMHWDSATLSLGKFREADVKNATLQGGIAIFEEVLRFAEPNALVLTLSVRGDGKVAGLFIKPVVPPYQLPSYAKRETYDERNVAIDGAPSLPAVLSLPKGKGPHRAVVLVHGSGPNDRDETIGALKPFADLAHGLASRGVAVLRFDKRTFAAPKSLTGKDFTVEEEVLLDVRRAVAKIAAMPEIDRKHIVVVGHSMGAYLAPRIAKGDSTIAAIAMLAASTRGMLELAREQLAYLKVPNAETVLGNIKGAAPASYWKDLDAYSPTETARALTIPMLILQGDRDYQVPLKEYEAWQRALEKRKSVTFKRYAKLNHAFVAGTGTSRPEEYQTPGHVDVAVIDDLASFVKGLP